ncbi:unnamed protein product [Penicillium discolor]
MATDSRLSKMNSSIDPPSYEETTQVTRAAIIACLISQLENARNGNSVLSILSDNELGVDDKCIAMEYTDQIPAIAEEKEAMLLENELRLQGSHRLAQSVCYYYNTRHTSKDRVWCKTLIEADIEIRWIVQRMIWVHQHLRATRFTAFRQHLKKLNQQYWRAHRKLWIAEDAKIVRDKEVAVGGHAGVARDHERLMGLKQKGCLTEATALQRALVV